MQLTEKERCSSGDQMCVKAETQESKGKKVRGSGRMGAVVHRALQGESKELMQLTGHRTQEKVEQNISTSVTKKEKGNQLYNLRSDN